MNVEISREWIESQKLQNQKQQLILKGNGQLCANKHDPLTTKWETGHIWEEENVAMKKKTGQFWSLVTIVHVFCTEAGARSHGNTVAYSYDNYSLLNINVN